jgi:hypothetical protein
MQVNMDYNLDKFLQQQIQYLQPNHQVLNHGLHD